MADDNLLPGLREAIKIIRGMGSNWPDALGWNTTGVIDWPQRYGEQFVRRIEESIAIHEQRVREE